MGFEEDVSLGPLLCQVSKATHICSRTPIVPLQSCTWFIIPIRPEVSGECARLKSSHIERAGMPENVGFRPVQSLSDPFRDIAHAFFKELPLGTVTTLHPKPWMGSLMSKWRE